MNHVIANKQLYRPHMIRESSRQMEYIHTMAYGHCALNLQYGSIECELNMLKMVLSEKSTYTWKMSQFRHILILY